MLPTQSTENAPAEKTQATKDFFDTFGFVRLPGFLADRIDAIEEDFESLWAGARPLDEGGIVAGGNTYLSSRRIAAFVDQRPRLASLLDDERVSGLAGLLMGEGWCFCGSDGNLYNGDSGWHSDGYNKAAGRRHVKLAIYLDHLAAESGALRVMPGTHLPGDVFADAVEAQRRRSVAVWGIHPRDIPCVVLESAPGDVIAFDHNLKHASFGGSRRRRMFTLNLCEALDCSNDAPATAAAQHSFALSTGWADLYGDLLLTTAPPSRLPRIEQYLASDGSRDPGRSARLRALLSASTKL
jgi:hypothetical protein